MALFARKNEYFLLILMINVWLFESFILLPGCTDQGSGGMHKLPLNLGHFHPKDSHLFLALFPSYTRLKIITQSGKKTKRGLLRTSAFIPPSSRYHPSFIWFFAPEKSGNFFTCHDVTRRFIFFKPPPRENRLRGEVQKVKSPSFATTHLNWR